MGHRPAAVALLLLASSLGCRDAPPTAPRAGDLPPLRVVRSDAAPAVRGLSQAPSHLPAQASAARLAAVAVSVEDLGELGGDGRLNVANAINEAGQVAGSSSVGTDCGPTCGGFSDRAYLWDRQKAMRSLDLPSDASSSLAFDLNDRGQVVGQVSVSAPGTGTVDHAFLWDRERGMRDLGSLGGNFAQAIAINAAGDVVGSGEDALGQLRAFLWTAGGGMEDLGTLGGSQSLAAGINAAGHVVGTAGTADGAFRAFLWTREVGMVDLGTLGGRSSQASDINDAGQVVGTSALPSGEQHAFVWTAREGMTDLGTLGGRSSIATAINAAGQVVGTSERAGGGSDRHGFYWEPGAGMIPLAPLAGYTRAFATDLNAAGQVTGASFNDGGNAYRSVLWTVRRAGAPVVSRLQAAPLPPGVYAEYAPDGGVWLRVRLTDADTPAPGPWAWRIDWGDGVVHTPSVAIKGEFAFVRATPYATAGPHTIAVSVTDPAGLASAPATTRLP
jgi:probable HAF family extracellular repeat protein